ncbi:MAG: cytochrome c maturation protein CcmE [Hyphomonadaceae bacterium]|nr:cytochrome c maturation protein CcmE [Hyphomonadaceae bacterium]MCA8885647.1 cytochrome c maturation protein CcmE [Hyphomonadaceae bacterium]
MSKMRKRDQRLMIIGVAGAVLVLAATLTFAGLRDSVVYFVSPSELAEKAQPGQRIRLGGLVVEGTVQRAGDIATFSVTDGATAVQVRYEGLLPDLFREGQGVVCEGSWRPGQAFDADRVLAKHDENYMPREVAEALKQRGEWKGDSRP